jgi:hypothetical protein
MKLRTNWLELQLTGVEWRSQRSFDVTERKEEKGSFASGVKGLL